MTKDRVLITGGAGFIGSHMADALVAAGHDVRVIDDFSTGRSENVEHLVGHPRFHLTRASITDESVLDRLVSESDVVIHLAAAVGVRLIVERPVHTIETNVRGTECVLRAALRYNSRTLIASTSEVYGKGASMPFREDDDVLLGSTSKSRWAYAASKMVDEFLAFAYHREHGLPVFCVRLFNTVGPRQTGQYGMVIPRFMRAALRGEPLQVYGDGAQTRCFCDVSDVVRALELLMNHEQSPGKLFNVGGNEEISIRKLAELTIEVAASNSEIEFVPYSEAYASGFEDMQRRVPDTSRMQAATGWEPEVGTREILVRVRDWMSASGRE